MTNPLENIWVSILDSSTFRKFVNAEIGKKIFRSSSYHNLLRRKNYFSTKIACYHQPKLFDGVETFVFFIGHNKSGTSMIGSLLDAHPDAVVSDEVGAIHYLSQGFNRDQVFHLLVRGSRRELMKGRVTARRLTPYSYLVPGQWQGRSQDLKVIGDGKAGSTTSLLSKQPQLLSRLPELVSGSKLKIIQTIRNPFDVISVMMVRGNRTFDNSISHYFNQCEILSNLRSQLDDVSLLALRYEQFVHAPGDHLRSLCSFLGLEPDEEYIQACESIIHEEPVLHRNMVEWDEQLINTVQEKINQYDFLQGYSFD